MDEPTDVSRADVEELDRILREGELHTVYQPVVDLYTLRVSGYEALARGPAGSPLEHPRRLFATARACGRLVELDWHCRAAAVRGALDAGMPAPLSLFLNIEPETLGSEPPEGVEELMARARAELHVVVEFTEHALTSRPAQMLSVLDSLRDSGWAVAVDDVGAQPASLALMPVIRPDVIKLDLRLVAEHASAEIAHIVNAVSAEAERSGSIVLAEGIEDEQQLVTALSVGAAMGQGWHFGRPGPLPDDLSRMQRGVPLRGRPRPCPATASPYEIVARQRTPREANKSLLLSMTRQLEREAEALGSSALLVASFQEARHFTRATGRRYERLAQRAPFVGALGAGMPLEPVPGVWGGPLQPGDPAEAEWNVAVVGPHFAAALVARDLGYDAPDLERRFEYAVTYHRDLAVQVAESLMHRVHPMVESNEVRALLEALG